jgi:D-arabinose 1-dehydrogenase-like Zn-dependent alcohol dehydrogenase
MPIARGSDKESLAKQLGARDYIDNTTGDTGAALQQLGGAKIILATAPSAQAMAATIGGLSLDGRLVVLGADFTPMPLNTAGLIGKRTGIYGWPSGPSIDSEDAEVLGNDRGTSDDRDISARESTGSI